MLFFKYIFNLIFSKPCYIFFKKYLSLLMQRATPCKGNALLCSLQGIIPNLYRLAVLKSTLFNAMLTSSIISLPLRRMYIIMIVPVYACRPLFLVFPMTVRVQRPRLLRAHPLNWWRQNINQQIPSY